MKVELKPDIILVVITPNGTYRLSLDHNDNLFVATLTTVSITPIHPQLIRLTTQPES